MKLEEKHKVMVPGLLGCETRLMDEDEMNFLMALSLLDSKGAEETPESKGLLESDPGYTIIKSRLEHQGGSASDEAIIICSDMARGIPGRMVMWAYTLFRIQKITGNPVTLQKLCFHMPDGVPTEEAYRKAWEGQKCKTLGLEGDNALDNQDWNTLIEEVE